MLMSANTLNVLHTSPFSTIKEVHEQETRYLSGTMADAPKLLLFGNSEADLTVRVADKPVGWKAVSQEEKVNGIKHLRILLYRKER